MLSGQIRVVLRQLTDGHLQTGNELIDRLLVVPCDRLTFHHSAQLNRIAQHDRTLAHDHSVANRVVERGNLLEPAGGRHERRGMRAGAAQFGRNTKSERLQLADVLAKGD